MKLDRTSMLYGTLILTGTSIVSQFLGFVYRILLSRLIGAEVMGLYQLIMPVFSVIMALTAVGLTGAVSNLSSQYHARGNRAAIAQVLRRCLAVFLLLFAAVAAVVVLLYDPISVYLLGDARTQLGLLLLLPCILLTGIENLHKHYFYGTGNIRPPAAVELTEQFIRTGAVLGLLVLLLPLFLGQDPNVTDRTAGFWAPPSPAHLLGTDEAGRDLLSRLLAGGRVSLLVGFASAALGGVLGVPLGLLAGYKGGKWEYWIMRACDTFQSFPSILLVLAMVTLLGPSVWNIILVIGGLGWASVARLVYSGTLSAKKAEYVEASRALGATDREILFRTILPNVVAPVWASLPLKVVRAILSESSLSFLGVGLRTPQASWGNLTQSAMELVTLTTRPWAWLPPGLCIVATGLALLLVGEGLRKALNPRNR